MEINIKHIAKLAKLSLPEEKLQKFEADMMDILGMVENLPELTQEAKLVDENNTMDLREDVAVPSLSRDDMLRNAPQAAAGCIVMPKVVE
ncbi:MAG: Asp-tRNA(Asn)/Glu-tRNA(Gln) amidotransferase subunit GatC [Oscillospiraceae bacterium]|nr:Asp-tRNA(Asn)/Glu-tRNA(Gln) amidotransferase subunit GatC [Oscillospiraceae bacterium]